MIDEQAYKRIDDSVEHHSNALWELALRIHANPELRFQETRASQWIADFVTKTTGLSVERGLGGLSTALRARTGNSKPRLAMIAEYDALPEIGHACGHNLIAAAAVGAFVSIADCMANEAKASAIANELKEFTGSVDLIGTPAEEGGGGKITLLKAGAFQDINAAMMIHPFDRDLLAHATLANQWLAFAFQGTPSHAAIAPWEGASALTACTQMFHLIDSQRIHFRDGVRVHGWITNGGQAINIIPERAACEFSVRAPNSIELERVRAIVERCARAAALAAGVEVEIKAGIGYREMKTNLPLANALGKHLTRLGRHPQMHDPEAGCGSTDMGDVSQTIPSIHPWIAICKEGEAQCHQHKFAELAASKSGREAMVISAKSMACTALDYLQNAELRSEVQNAFPLTLFNPMCFR